MKTKNEVAIKLTEENRLEVFNLLNEFNQPMSWGVDNQLRGECGLSFEVLIFRESVFYGICHGDTLSNYGSKEIVSIDDLRQILAVEAEVKELEVGNWYKFGTNGLFCYQGTKENYGFDNYGYWNTDLGNYTNTGEATEQEVCEALEKECVSRYGEDWHNVKIVAHADDFKDDVNDSKFLICIDLFEIWNKNGVIYHNGVWAEQLKEDEVTCSIKGSDIQLLLERSNRIERPELKPKTHWLIRNWSKISVAIDTINLVGLVYFGSKMTIHVMLGNVWSVFGYFLVTLFYAWVLRINLKK